MMGSFNNVNDPNSLKLRDVLLRRAVDIANKNKGLNIAPANRLTDLENPDRPIKIALGK